MKNLNLLLLLIAVSLVACKTQKIPPRPQPVAQETAVPAPAVKPAATTKPVGKPVSVTSREESFTDAQGETADYGTNKYFIILGSFGVFENAQRLKATLQSEGFHPGIIKNESGMFRVFGNSYATENDARTRISDVRAKYPKYSDIWLCIKK